LVLFDFILKGSIKSAFHEDLNSGTLDKGICSTLVRNTKLNLTSVNISKFVALIHI